MVRDFSIIFIQVREKSRKTNYLVSISLSLTIGLVLVAKSLPYLLSVNVNLITWHCEIESICALPIY